MIIYTFYKNGSSILNKKKTIKNLKININENLNNLRV
jgi:hypothetical protein